MVCQQHHIIGTRDNSFYAPTACSWQCTVRCLLQATLPDASSGCVKQMYPLGFVDCGLCRQTRAKEGGGFGGGGAGQPQLMGCGLRVPEAGPPFLVLAGAFQWLPCCRAAEQDTRVSPDPPPVGLFAGWRSLSRRGPADTSAGADTRSAMPRRRVHTRVRTLARSCAQAALVPACRRVCIRVYASGLAPALSVHKGGSHRTRPLQA